MQDGTLLIIGQSGTTNTNAVLLTPDTGMIGTPMPIEDTVNSLEVGEIRRGWKVKSLLQGDINPADIIAIESRFVNGQFVIESVEHKGDTHSNEWFSEVICYNNETQTIRTEKGKEKKKEPQKANTVVGG